jgi:hypothetical protein
MCTLYSRSVHVIFIVAGVRLSPAAVRPFVVGGVELVQVHLLDLVPFGHRERRPRGQDALQTLEGLLVGEVVLGERDLECNVQVALLERTLVKRHPLAHHSLQIARLDDVTGGVLDQEVAPVQLPEDEVEAAQCLRQGDGAIHEQVVAAPLERVVRLLVQDYDDVAGFHVGLLVALAAEEDFLPVLHALVDVDLQDFRLVAHLNSQRFFHLMSKIQD